tara:strand:+ start:126 stop:1046 length:921 start_codon:yes stop_codon:yes gene_type:complete
MTYKLIKTADLVEIKDIPSANLHSHLRMFMIRVQKIFPLCSFAQRIVNQGKDTQMVYVYHKHKPLVMGWIGYGDFRYQSNGKSEDYVVNSRKIANGKYSEGTHNFFTVMSANMKVAMRNVNKYLVDYGPGELAEAYSSDAAERWSNTATTLASNLRVAGNELVPPYSYAMNVSEISPLEAELQMLVNTGYKFINPQFSERVDKFLSTRKKITEEIQGRSPVLTMVSVEVSPTSGNTLFVVARTEDINGRDINSSYYTASWAPKGTFVEDTLDRDIMGKLSILQMCEVGHWVDGVGYRPTDTVFYVV